MAVLIDGYQRNGLLNGITSCLMVFAIEFLFDSVDFTCQMCVCASAINANVPFLFVVKKRLWRLMVDCESDGYFIV